MKTYKFKTVSFQPLTGRHSEDTQWTNIKDLIEKTYKQVVLEKQICGMLLMGLDI